MKVFLFALVICVVSTSGAERGFVPLFNGNNLDGWQGMGGPTTNWAVKDGMLSCTGQKGSQWIATKNEYADFDLRLEYKIPKNGNSGRCCRFWGFYIPDADRNQRIRFLWQSIAILFDRCRKACRPLPPSWWSVRPCLASRRDYFR